MNILFYILIGFILGFSLAILIFLKASLCGTFVIDMSNVDKDIYRLEMGNLDDVPKKKYVTLKIKSVMTDISHE